VNGEGKQEEKLRKMREKWSDWGRWTWHSKIRWKDALNASHMSCTIARVDRS